MFTQQRLGSQLSSIAGEGEGGEKDEWHPGTNRFLTATSPHGRWIRDNLYLKFLVRIPLFYMIGERKRKARDLKMNKSKTKVMFD